MPILNIFEANRPGSISVALPWRCRLTSQKPKPAIAIAPPTRSAPTASAPSCHARMPSTIPPMPTIERTAPTTSTSRDPV